MTSSLRQGMWLFSAPTVVFALVALLTGCALGDATDQGKDEGGPTVAGRTTESTRIRAGGGDITGLITRIIRTNEGPTVLIEEDPDANCRRERDIRRNPCQKRYLIITDKTRVLRGRQGAGARASDLKKGQKVIGMAGDDLATSYPTQGTAEQIVILKNPQRAE